MKTALWIGGLGLLLIGVIYFFRKELSAIFLPAGADGGAGDGSGAPPAETPEHKLLHTNFIALCKAENNNTEASCEIGWTHAEEKGITTWGDWVSHNTPDSISGCVPFTRGQRQKAWLDCWKDCFRWGFIPIAGGAILNNCVEKCRKNIPPITTCP